MRSATGPCFNHQGNKQSLTLTSFGGHYTQSKYSERESRIAADAQVVQHADAPSAQPEAESKTASLP